MHNKQRHPLCVIPILLALLLVVLTGCNTVRGLGQDIESAGGAIERKAEQKKTY